MSNIIKSTGVIIAISAVHFVLCRLVVLATMQFNLAGADGGQSLPLFTSLLINITRILYFPIITMSLYSRQMFPGNWIFVPIIVNSLLWGITIYLGYLLWKILFARKNS